MRLSKVLQEETTIQVPVGDEKVEVRYRPGAFTPALQDELDELGSGTASRVGRRFCESLCKVLASWDLEEDNGEPVPLDPDRLTELPAQFLAKLLEVVAEDMRPGEAQGSSGATSPQVAASGSSPPGTGSSPPPGTSASLPGI
jgi:hypothetical protein